MKLKKVLFKVFEEDAYNIFFFESIEDSEDLDAQFEAMVETIVIN